MRKLGDLFHFVNGRGFKKSEWKESGLPIIRIQNLNNSNAEFNHYSGTYDKKIEINKGDLLFSWSGTVGTSFGPHIWNREKGLLNQHIFKLEIKERVDRDYAFYSLKYITAEIEKQVNGAVGLVHITKEKLNRFEIPLPPLPEQQRIVAILDEAFAATAKAKANAEQNLKNAKELFDVYLHKFYTSKEEGWEQKKLKEVAEYFNGLTYSPKDVSNEGIIVLRSSNVQNDVLDFNDIVRVNLTVKEKIIVQDGDILMCSRNGSARLVGKTATIKNIHEKMTFGTFMMIVRSHYNPYLSWFFKSTDFRNQIKGGENTMINQITRYMLDDIVLSFPPVDKQNEIVQKLDALNMEVKKLDAIYIQKINDLEELKKSILQKAFSGELKTAKALV